MRFASIVQTIPLVALVASLAVNGYLATRPHQKSTYDKRDVSVVLPNPQQCFNSPPVSIGSALDRDASAPGSGVASIAQSLEKCREDLAKHLPLNERFLIMPAETTAVSPLHSAIDASLAKKGINVTYDLDCRGEVCRISPLGRLREDFVALVQESDDLKPLVHKMQFGPDAIYMQTVEPEDAAGAIWLNDVAASIATDPSIRECERRNSAEGTLYVALVSGTAGAPAITLDGSLQHDAVADCVRAAVGTLLASKPDASGIHIPSWPIAIIE